MKNQNAASRLGACIAALRQCSSVFWKWEARFKGVEMHGRVVFAGRPLLSVVQGGRMVLGNGVRVASALRSNPLGLAQPSVLRVMAPGAELILGTGVGISGTTICAGKRIEIGEQTLLGAGVLVIDNDFHAPSGEWGWITDSALNARPIQIGRGVFIGARAIILKGVTIGDRAVIGAGAVVTHDVPARSTAAGNPARVMTCRTP